MDVITCYPVKIKHYNHIFDETIKLYRCAVDFFIKVCLDEWDAVATIPGIQKQQAYIENIVHATKARPVVRYDFDRAFYKFPSYLRRAAIRAAIGKVSSYKSNLANYAQNPQGKAPSAPRAGHSFPAMFRDGCFVRTGEYTARIKV